MSPTVKKKHFRGKLATQYFVKKKHKFFKNQIRILYSKYICIISIISFKVPSFLWLQIGKISTGLSTRSLERKWHNDIINCVFFFIFLL